MKFGEIVDMLRRFQENEHHGGYDHHKHGHDDHGDHGDHGHDKHGHYDRYEYNYHEGNHSKYGSQHSLQTGHCPKCDMVISSDHKFCPCCGVECKTYFECSSCHAKARPGDTYCSQCGSKM